LFLSKKGKALKENYWDKSENIENMTKILFEEVSSLDRRFKILEQQVKTIMQDLYGFRRITPDDSDERTIPIQKLTSEIKSKKEETQGSSITKELPPPSRITPNTSSKNLFSPHLSPTPEKNKDILLPKRFATSSPSESAHPPIIPTFPSPSQNKEKTNERAQKDTMYQIIPRVKLATKSRTD
jgi:DNA topoisomerase IA